MALPARRTCVCSGCIADAIVRHDEKALRQLLSDESAEFSDIYWIPIAILDDKEANTYSMPEFRTLSSQLVANAEQQCTHLMLAETLSPGRPANIAVSVVLMSMLNTNAEFNPLQMLIDSHKFDLSEPLLFHMHYSYQGKWMLSLVAVDPLGLAIQIDNESDIDNQNCNQLLTELFSRGRSSRLVKNPLNMNMCLMLLCLDYRGNTLFRSLRANRALSFFYGCRSFPFQFFDQLTCSNFISNGVYQRDRRLLSLLKVLCRIGLTVNADTAPTYCYKYTSYYKSLNQLILDTHVFNFKFLEFLIDMFENWRHDSKGYFTKWLSNGWIFAERER